MLVDQTLLLRVTFGEGLAQFWLISQAQYWRQFKSHVWHGIFLPVSFLCRLLQCLYSPHVHSYASTSEWTWKSPTPLFGHTKIQHTWRGMGSTALVTAVPYLRKVTWISCKEQWSTLNFKKVDICLTQLSLLFAPLAPLPQPSDVGGTEWQLVSCCLPLPQPCEWEALSDGLCCHAVSGQHGGGEGHLPGSQPEGNSGLHRTDHHHVAAPSSCGISCLWTLGGTCIQAAHFIPFDFTIVNTGHQIQTHKRLKRRLFIRTKHHVRAFRVVPFIKLQNNA